MDATKKPLVVPPDFSNYAESKGIFQVLQFLLEELLVERPPDPLTYLLNLLDHSSAEAPRAIVYGPPASGQYSVSKSLARSLRAVHVRPVVLLERDLKHKDSNSLPLLTEFEDGAKLAKLIYNRVQKEDCKMKGYILEGYPRTREQALQLQSAGVMINHWVHIRATDSVLLERYNGKRIDPITGDVYHTVFNPPSDSAVTARLIEEPGGIEHNMYKRLKCYHANWSSISKCYKHIARSFEADQPEKDLVAQIQAFLHTRQRSAAPHTPRVLLMGQAGAGKSWQSHQLSEKYRLVDVDVSVLIRQTAASGLLLAQQIKLFTDKNLPGVSLRGLPTHPGTPIIIPDDMMVQMISNRLTQLDCSTRGWVLHGFPLSREQAELLDQSGLAPNRVFFMTVPLDIIKERLCCRRIDPITGERYHLLYSPPVSQEVKDRLLTHKDDCENSVEERVSDYNLSIGDIEDYYRDRSVYVNGDQDPYTILETLESYIINPLPKKESNEDN